ncbi:MAG: phage tail tape measure protein, partial [Vogesella sp.]|uniref:phage tail tape measure protein n=1 Tax=Vogesella sp. TaxID=1904252 RepID=UPI003F32044A
TSAQWAMLKNRLTELTVNLGSILLPTLGKIMGTLGPLVSRMADWAQAHPAITHALIGTVVALAAFKVASLGVRYGANLVLSQFTAMANGARMVSARLTMLKGMYQAGAFAPLTSRLSPVLSRLPAMPAGGLAGVGRGLMGGFQAALPWLGRAASMLLRLSPIGLALSVVGLLVYKYWQPIKGFFVGLWQGLSSVAGPALGALGEGSKRLGLAFGRLIMTVTPLGVIFRLLKPAVMPVLGAIADGAKGIWRWFTNLLAPVDDAGGKAQNMGLRFGQAIGGIIKAVVDLPARFIQLGADIVNGLVKGIQGKIGSAVQAIGEVGNKVATKFRSVLGIKSPSRLFMGFGQNIGEGAAIGIGQRIGLAGKAAGALATATVIGFGAPALATPTLPVPHPPAIPAMAVPEVAMPCLPPLPSLAAPAVPVPQVPTLPALRLAVPEMAVPRLPDMPTLTVPPMVPPAVTAMPAMAAPEVAMPRLPQLPPLSAPAVLAPQVPTLPALKLAAPEMAAPRLQDMPTLTVPAMVPPASQALTAPVSVAQRQPGTPVFAMPAMPTTEMPSTALPTVGKSGGAPVTVTF